MNKRDQTHLALVLGEGERMRLVNLLNQERPVHSEILVGQFRIKDAGDLLNDIRLFPLAALL